MKFNIIFSQVRVKCNPDDTIGDLKKLIAAQTGTRYDKIVLKKWYTIFKDNIRLSDCILFNLILTTTHIHLIIIYSLLNIYSLTEINLNR